MAMVVLPDDRRASCPLLPRCGKPLGLDEVRNCLRSDTTSWHRVAVVLGSLTAAIGALGMVKASGHDFGASFGSYLGPASASPKGYELSLMAFNTRGALVVVLFGLAMVAAGVLRIRPVLDGVTAVSAVLSALLVFQFERNPRGVSSVVHRRERLDALVPPRRHTRRTGTWRRPASHQRRSRLRLT